MTEPKPEKKKRTVIRLTKGEEFLVMKRIDKKDIDTTSLTLDQLAKKLSEDTGVTVTRAHLRGLYEACKVPLASKRNKSGNSRATHRLALNDIRGILSEIAKMLRVCHKNFKAMAASGAQLPAQFNDTHLEYLKQLVARVSPSITPVPVETQPETPVTAGAQQQQLPFQPPPAPTGPATNPLPPNPNPLVSPNQLPPNPLSGFGPPPTQPFRSFPGTK